MTTSDGTTTLTPLGTETGTFGSGYTKGDYITFSFLTPVSVSAGTYGFDFGNTLNNQDFYFQIDGAPDTSYSGGTAYSTGGNDGIATDTAVFPTTDRTFGVSFMAVLEPSSLVAAMLGSLGMMGMRLRRR